MLQRWIVSLLMWLTPICHCQQSNGANLQLNVTVGMVYDADGPKVGDADITMAQRNLKKAGIIPAHVNFRNIVTAVGQSGTGRYGVGSGNAIDLYMNNSLDVLLGPPDDTSMLTIAAAAKRWNLPVIGFGSLSAPLGNSSYSTFTRISYGNFPLAVLQLIQYFNWTTFGYLRYQTSTDAGNSGNIVCDSLIAGLHDVVNRDGTVTIATEIIFGKTDVNITATTPAAQAKFNLMRSRARIFVICPGTQISSGRELYAKLYAMNLTTPDFVYIVPYLRRVFDDQPVPWLASKPDSLIPLAMEACRNVISIDMDPQGIEKDVQHMDKVAETLRSKPFLVNESNPIPYNGSAIAKGSRSNFERYVYDAMYLYGMALNATMSQKGKSFKNEDVKNGLAITRAMINISFQGKTGMVKIMNDGRRYPQFSFVSFPGDSSWFTWGTMEMTPSDNGVKTVINQTQAPYFATIDGMPPADIPDCGFNGDQCINIANKTATIVAPIAAVGGFIIFILILTLKLRQTQNDSQFLNMNWKIEMTELHRISRGRTQKSIEDHTSETSGSRTSGLRSDVKSRAFSERSDRNRESFTKTPFIGIGLYRDQQVAIKEIIRYQPGCKFNKKHLLVLFTVRELRHENLNNFIGLIVPELLPPGYELWNYCTRGSLQDILFNEAIDLDMMFKSSMIKDMLRGVEYLHKSILQAHGNLCASNCVVDSRWIVKLTDFGLSQIISKLRPLDRALSESDDNAASESMFHLSPEALRIAFEKGSVNLSAESDIYSVGVVMFQILYREQPYAAMTISATQILRKIAYPGPTYQILRPKFPKGSATADGHGFESLIAQCWEEIASQRPSVAAVRDIVNSLTKRFSANIVDHVIKTMEDYTENLEKIVAQRSEELQKEKAAADALLRELLPRSVVDDLKAGKAVPPESYNSVSLYFSDIVQFTALCSTSSPVEVVTMLNLLYSNFDNITKLYDVYKVETIGDAYLVASGLPIRNGLKHATEIANMALHIRKFVLSDFNIPHRPGERLKVRIGIHTGSVAAGVIGLAMPRYCVFGVAVNMANLMESTGEPMKIHVSWSAAELLQNRGQYLLETRGLTNFGEIGEMETFWLVDKSK